tara:strand:+ start:973 stop:1458 length:486 start_codon:yes stop_codon:yes gene_type:complete
MDAATAALAGAAIGAAASVLAGLVGPWVRDAANRRARRRDDLRDLQRVELLGVIEALSSLFRSRYVGRRDETFAMQHTTAVVAINRLTVVTERRDRDLERMLAFALETVSDGHPKAAEIALRLSADTLHRWYRGEVRGSKIGDEFGRRLDEELDAATAPGA